jgi:hypothetical protein
MYGLVDVASGDLRWVGDASSILDAVKAADQEAGDEAFDYMEMPAATASATWSGSSTAPPKPPEGLRESPSFPNLGSSRI